ncbi:hypothetical protein N8Z28_00835 [bacterium]|nr:hypothetical protein [bacterium]
MILNRKQIILIIIFAKLLATSFSLFIFDQFSPLVDAKLYQNEFYTTTGTVFRTTFIQTIVIITNFITNPIISHYIFSIISILGVIAYVFYKKPKWPILLILCLPSSMIWTSVIGKEAIFYLCFSVLLIMWNQYIKSQFKLNHFLIVISASLICIILRPHYFICIPWLFWVAVVLKKQSYYKYIFLFSYLFIIISLFSIIFWGSYIDNYFGTNLFDITWRAYMSIDSSMGRSTRFDELGLASFDHQLMKNSRWTGNEAYKDILSRNFQNYFGLGFIFGIIGPFLKETLRRPEFIPFFIEGTIILISPIILFLYMKIKKLFNYKDINCLNYIYGVFPAIILVMIVHALFGILNPGTAIRWRVNFELIFYFAPMLLYFNILESKNEKNNSLSS